MCAPILGAVIGLVGTGIQMARQASIARKNEAASKDWAAYQRQQRLQETQNQERSRKQADAARQSTLDDVASDAQVENQQVEAERLEQTLGPEDQSINETVSDNLLSGQDRGSNIFQNSLKSKLSSATQEAKKRIAALASLQSYGGSQGGVATKNAEAFLQGGNAIDKANNKRSGSLSAYGAAKAVNPVQYFG